MYFIFCVHPAKSLMRLKKNIFCLKKYINIWYDLTFFIYTKKIQKHIFACTFGFNNQFIEFIRTWSIFK